jgi:hypothetical protein
VARQNEEIPALEFASKVFSEHLKISEKAIGTFKHQAYQMAHETRHAAVKAAHCKALDLEDAANELARKASKLEKKLQRHVVEATNKPQKGFIMSENERQK